MVQIKKNKEKIMKSILGLLALTLSFATFASIQDGIYVCKGKDLEKELTIVAADGDIAVQFGDSMRVGTVEPSAENFLITDEEGKEIYLISVKQKKEDVLVGTFKEDILDDKNIEIKCIFPLYSDI